MWYFTQRYAIMFNRRIDSVVKRVNKIKKILKTFAYSILILLVTLCLYTFLMTDILKKDYANVFGYTYFVVSTGSMSGTIEVNDIILVKITDEVKKDDIVTFKDESGAMVTHRVVEVMGNKVITKGDVNNSEDDPISKKNLVGKVKLIVSPSFILKSIAIFIILFIFLALVNFDKVVKKYIVKDDKDKVPEEVFKKNAEVIDKSTGLTVTIPLEELRNMEIEEPGEVEEDVELLEVVEVLDVDNNNIITKTNDSKAREAELLDQVVNLLRVKNDKINKSRINKKWLSRYQYVFKMANVLLINDQNELIDMMEHPTFKEIYDYDLEKVGLYENLRNKIYDMPIYIFLKILFFAVLYNDLEFFDGVFKIMKYKIQVDKDGYFRYISKKDTYQVKQIKNLISFMKKISNKYDNKNVFELDKIERMVKIKSYVNN